MLVKKQLKASPASGGDAEGEAEPTSVGGESVVETANRATISAAAASSATATAATATAAAAAAAATGSLQQRRHATPKLERKSRATPKNRSATDATAGAASSPPASTAIAPSIGERKRKTKSSASRSPDTRLTVGVAVDEDSKPRVNTPTELDESDGYVAADV